MFSDDDNKKRGELIGAIIANLKFEAKNRGLPFSEGDMFFTLAFRTYDELTDIKTKMGI